VSGREQNAFVRAKGKERTQKKKVKKERKTKKTQTKE
jgi:hypothetical protein